jgi:hypothetical protein
MVFSYLIIIGREKGLENVNAYLQTKTVVCKYDDYYGNLVELK